MLNNQKSEVNWQFMRQLTKYSRIMILKRKKVNLVDQKYQLIQKI